MPSEYSPGRFEIFCNDGLMARTDTNTLWVMANEDANPKLTIIDLTSGAQKTYTPTVKLFNRLTAAGT